MYRNDCTCVNWLIFKLFCLGETVIANLNYTALSVNTQFDRDTVETCVREILQVIIKLIMQ